MILSDTLSAHLPERPTAVALGFFDGIHRGHTKVISAAVQAARQQGLIPCVFTFSPPGKGGPKPVGELIQTDEVKQYILERMGVRQIFRPPFEEFRDLTPEEFVRKVLAERFQARVVACGENFHFGRNAAGNAELLCQLGQEYGIEVIVVPLERENGEVISSTLIDLTGLGGNALGCTGTDSQHQVAVISHKPLADGEQCGGITLGVLVVQHDGIAIGIAMVCQSLDKALPGGVQ